MKNVIKYFLQGLLYVVPIGVTIYVIYETFVILDELIPIDIPGLGILLIFVFITTVGVLGSHLVSDRLIKLFEGSLKRIPLINLIYTSVKDLMNAFVGEKKSFTQPVTIKLYENSEVRRLGFITNDNFADLGKNNDLITVYMPHSYNISGNVYLVPASYVEPVDVVPADLMKYTVSGGVTEVRKREKPPLEVH
jgi:uncharacterized membrane protein